MPKAPRPGASRKPPEPSASHAEIEDWLRRVMPDLQPIVRWLDEAIRAAVPDVEYALKWPPPRIDAASLAIPWQAAAGGSAGDDCRPSLR
jgi:hypothetical protein